MKVTFNLLDTATYTYFTIVDNIISPLSGIISGKSIGIFFQQLE